MNPPLKLSLRTARILSLLVLGGIGIGYLGGAIFAGDDETTPVGFLALRLVGLLCALLLFIDGRGQLTQSNDSVLDERERAMRDKSYVTTHQIMVSVLFGGFIWSLFARLADGWLPGQEQAINMLSGFAITSMALPGIILAWREQPHDDVE